MNLWVNNPNIYELNTRIWLKDLSERFGKNIDLSNVPGEVFKEFANMGIDALWLMGVWKPSEIGREIAKNHEGLRGEFLRTLPDLKEEDIVASPYGIGEYVASNFLGGNEGLSKFRKQAIKYGLKIILDFVPNHTGLDFPWIKQHPEYYIRGDVQDLQNDPSAYFNASSEKKPLIIAHGKDPYFSAWTDTAQLNYFNPDLRKAQINLLCSLAEICDGIRCDMAMLMLNEIHLQTWKDKLVTGNLTEFPGEFWEEAIKSVKSKYPDFLFIAEAYWQKEGELQRLDFDYTYDKALYDWLKEADRHSVFNYISQFEDYQKKCIRFIENHDEARAGNVFGNEHNKTAALIASTLPGAMLWHEGQFEGLKVRCPVQLIRRFKEEINTDLKVYYSELLKVISSKAFHEGEWTLYYPENAWEGNFSNNNFLIWSWNFENEQYLVVANLSPFRSQCYVRLSDNYIKKGLRTLKDLLSDAVYERDGEEICGKGLYLDIGEWQRHLFKID